MENKEYFEELESRINQMQILRKEGLVLATRIIGKTLYREDLFFVASLDRSMQLIDGVKILLKERNLSCLGAVLRLQMDNCMRTYAAFIAEDKNQVIDCIIYGGRIRDIKDKNGQKMTDAYLKEQMTVFDSSFPQIYDKTSGYIHLSDSAFYQTVVSCDDNVIEWIIGQPVQEKHNDIMLQIADLYIRFIKLHYKMLETVAESKKRCDDAAE